MSIELILKNTNYHLDLFSDAEIAALERLHYDQAEQRKYSLLREMFEKSPRDPVS